MELFQQSSSNLAICATCKHSQRKCAGPCACLVDPENPIDIFVRAETGCPVDYFAKPPCRWCGSQEHAGEVCENKPAATVKTPDPVPRNEWPVTVSLIAALRGGDDKGLGDTIHNQTTILGVDWAGKTIDALKAFGIDCGCTERREWLNARYPYLL